MRVMPLRGGPLFLGQVRLSQATQRQYIPQQGWPFEHPFTPGETPEEYERKETYGPKVAQKQSECNALEQAYMDAEAQYNIAPEEGKDAALDAWQKAENAYNQCLDQMDTLVNAFEFGPPSGTVEWPKEVPEPTIQPVTPQQPPPPAPPPVASVHQVPPPASGLQVTSNCGPGQFVDPVTRQCRGSVATGFTPGGIPTQGATTAGTPLLGMPIRAIPLYEGRF